MKRIIISGFAILLSAICSTAYAGTWKQATEFDYMTDVTSSHLEYIGADTQDSMIGLSIACVQHIKNLQSFSILPRAAIYDKKFVYVPNGGSFYSVVVSYRIDDARQQQVEWPYSRGFVSKVRPPSELVDAIRAGKQVYMRTADRPPFRIDTSTSSGFAEALAKHDQTCGQ